MNNTSGHNKVSRRDAIKSSALGIAAYSASSLLGAQTVLAQNNNLKPTDSEFTNKTAFITGGARGIGLAIAAELAKAGVNIVLFDIASGYILGVDYPVATEKDLHAAKATIESLGVKCLEVKGDVRNREQLEKAMTQSVTQFGSLDFVIANAGVSQAGAIEEFSEEQVRAVFDINVSGAIKTTQAAAPILKKQKSGRIIYISSALGRMGNSLFPIYTSSKWAVIGFAKSAALAYGRDNILCNTICPGLVHTKLADNTSILHKMRPQDDAPTFQKVSEMQEPNNPIAVGHLEPEDVANAVKFFCSNATAKVTGEVFDISYGSTATNVG